MGIERGSVRTRVRAWGHIVLVALAVVALGAPLLTPSLSASAVPSTTYPTWAQVKAARASEAATKKQIAQIEALLTQLKNRLAAAQADEIAKGEAFEQAQNAYDEQVMVADELSAQAEAARSEAGEAKERANKLLAMLAKSGNGDVVVSLLGAGASEADGLLRSLETMNRVSGQSEKLYAEALQLQNTAQSLGDQADVAEKKRDELREFAEKALDAARVAREAADAALQEQEDHQVELEAQLTVLKERREATEADYRKGVIAREKARKAALAAAAAAAAKAGQVNSRGWARPSAGYISSGYGMRYHPIYHTWRLHNGTDIAGQGCGAPIRAAHSGTVTYAGWNGTLGNYVQINHGDGSSSGYGHIVSGGILVRYGQHVNAGQQIARVGSTGASTGCHVHFIIRVNGQLTNPVPFMRNRGVILG
ncbi:MAG TPA: peptidoglycan DD-metalloendopeptidase family protein [Pseudolysinimonas sp.]|nr:peptidoglycan DD-metalloendopeptidase family protein [Pseudolysinimonas sp.]